MGWKLDVYRFACTFGGSAAPFHCVSCLKVYWLRVSRKKFKFLKLQKPVNSNF